MKKGDSVSRKAVLPFMAFMGASSFTRIRRKRCVQPSHQDVMLAVIFFSCKPQIHPRLTLEQKKCGTSHSQEREVVLLQATRLPNGPLQLESVRRPQAVFVAGRAGYCSRDVGLSFFFWFFFCVPTKPIYFSQEVGPGSSIFQVF